MISTAGSGLGPAEDFDSWLWLQLKIKNSWLRLQLMITTADSGLQLMMSTADSGSSWWCQQLPPSSSCRVQQLNLKFCQLILAGVSSSDSGPRYSIISWWLWLKFRQLTLSPAESFVSWLCLRLKFHQLTLSPAESFVSWLCLRLKFHQLTLSPAEVSSADSVSGCSFVSWLPPAVVSVSADTISSWKFRQLIASTGTEVLDGAERLADLVGRGHEE